MPDALGDRMKMYESRESGRAMPRLPVLARLDGKCFSNWTRGLDRPYDIALTKMMVAVTKGLVQQTSALMGYTQSDEITLLWYSPDARSQIYLDGKTQKMCSVLASMATWHFNYLVPMMLSCNEGMPAFFDCRVWTVPTQWEAANAFLWRVQDATKNSISMAAQTVYSHKELHKKHQGDMQEMLFQKGINWNDYPAFFKRGTFIQKRSVERAFTCDEIDKLPPKHEAHTNPDLKIERSDYVELDMPPFGKVTNKIGVLFGGEEPRTEETFKATKKEEAQ
jgi:tRNA(His) 5'-end guanylyltransferase